MVYMYIFIYIYLMKLKGSKVCFKHPLYTLGEHLKSGKNFSKLIRSPFVIFALLIGLVKVKKNIFFKNLIYISSII